jgi:hypothetical protein
VRRAFALLGLLVALFAVPGSALATTTQTGHLTGVPIDVGPALCIPGDIILTGNAVLHITVNNAGDSWMTGTIEGAVTGSLGYTGHGQAWFGLEDNNKNGVAHFTTNINGTLGDGLPLRIHQQGQYTVNAQGMIVVNNVTVTCS